MVSSARSLLLAALFAGCAEAPFEEQGGQFGEEMPPPCGETRVELGPGELVEDLGIGAEQARAWLASTWTAPLQWTEPLEARVDQLQLTSSPDAGAATWLVREPPAGGAEADCADGLLLPATLTLRSLDGLLDESLALELRLFDAERAEFDLALTPDAVGGDLAEALGEGGDGTFWLLIAGHLELGGGTEGALSQVVDGTDAAESEPIPLGSWLSP